jgi:hypothetical protein
MFQISKNNVKMVRGDTGSVELNLTDENGNAIMPDAYTAIFSLKKNIDDVAYIMQKQFVNGKVEFTHADTNNLPYGQYVYDVQVEILQDNSIHTIGANTFTIAPDVTRE